MAQTKALRFWIGLTNVVEGGTWTSGTERNFTQWQPETIPRLVVTTLVDHCTVGNLKNFFCKTNS